MGMYRKQGIGSEPNRDQNNLRMYTASEVGWEVGAANLSLLFAGSVMDYAVWIVPESSVPFKVEERRKEAVKSRRTFNLDELQLFLLERCLLLWYTVIYILWYVHYYHIKNM